MGDDRYRIRADQLDDYSLRPDGAELSTGHDADPPPDLPPFRAPLENALPVAGPVFVPPVSTASPRLRRLERVGAVVALAGFALFVVLQLRELWS